MGNDFEKFTEFSNVFTSFCLHNSCENVFRIVNLCLYIAHVCFLASVVFEYIETSKCLPLAVIHS